MNVPTLGTVIVTERSDAVIVGAVQPSACIIASRPGPPPIALPEEQGPAGPKGEKGDQGPPGAVPTYTAGAVISGDKALMFSGAFTVVHADPTADGYIYAGIAMTAAQPGGMVAAQTSGDIQASFWAWSPGLPIFVSPDGNLTQNPPDIGRSHLIGWATDAHTVHLAPDPIITFT